MIILGQGYYNRLAGRMSHTRCSLSAASRAVFCVFPAEEQGSSHGYEEPTL